MILASRQQNNTEEENRRENKRGNRTDNRKKQTSGLQKAPNLQDSIQNHLENSKHWNSKKKFLSFEQPSSSL